MFSAPTLDRSQLPGAPAPNYRTCTFLIHTRSLKISTFLKVDAAQSADVDGLTDKLLSHAVEHRTSHRGQKWTDSPIAGGREDIQVSGVHLQI